MNIKITYRIFGEHQEFTETITLKSPADFRLLIGQHVSSSSAYLWIPNEPFRVQIVQHGVINTFVYNNIENIIALMNNPKLLDEMYEVFPIKLVELPNEG